MTLLQEAYSLMQGQPERNIQLIVKLLQTMTPKKDASVNTAPQEFRRTGLSRGSISLPHDFDETFDALDRDVEELFYGDAL